MRPRSSRVEVSRVCVPVVSASAEGRWQSGSTAVKSRGGCQCVLVVFKGWVAVHWDVVGCTSSALGGDTRHLAWHLGQYALAGRARGWVGHMEPVPETTFARAPDGTFLAYQVSGAGPLDVVFLVGGAIPVEDQMEGRECASFIRRLSAFGRVIRLDRHGIGMSDPLTGSTPWSSGPWTHSP